MKRIKVKKTPKSLAKHPNMTILLILVCMYSLFFMGCENKEKTAESKKPISKDQILGLETQPVAKINGASIPVEEFNALYTQKKEFIAAKYKNVSDSIALVLKRSIAGELIDNALVEQESKKLGIEITDADIQAAIVAEKTKYPSEEKFNQVIANLPGGKARFYELIKIRLIKEKLTGIDKNEPVLNADIKKFYQSNQHRYVRPSHLSIQEIVIPKNGRDAESKAAELHEQITQQNISFSYIAKKYSKAPSAKIGGYRNHVDGKNISVPLWNALQQLKDGESSSVIKDGESFYILRRLRTNPAINKSLDDVRDEIVTIIRTRRHNAKIGEMLHTLRSENQVENFILTRYENELKKYKNPKTGSPSVSAHRALKDENGQEITVKENKEGAAVSR